MMNFSESFLLFIFIFLIAAGCEPTSQPMNTYPVTGSLESLDPLFDELVPSDTNLEILADGFAWTEGPIWRASGDYLLFTDIPNNTIQKWSETGGLEVFLRPAGYTRPDAPGRELGSNGLTFDSQDRLVMADHGNRQVARLNESNYTKETLADNYEGNRFNSPNDLIYHSNGDLYFTDPPYGLQGIANSPLRELDYSGVYRLTPSGELTLLVDDLTFPNGIAFSPDEETLYVAVSDPDNPVWMAYDVQEDGTVANGRVFFDSSELVELGRPGMPDGMTLNQDGVLFATGPGGVLVLSPEGTHLGTILTGQPTANCKFGDDGSTLYVTSNTELMRIQLNTTGLGF